MTTWIAELLLKTAFYVANPFTVRGQNLRQSIYDYFYRFRFAPAPVRATRVEYYGMVREEGQS